MVTELNLEAINAHAPYQVSMARVRGLEFVTDYGVRYVVDFIPEDTLLSFETYEFVIINVNNSKSPNDVKVKDTIMAVISEFFRKNQSVMLYLCDTSDGKQALRSRLFSKWFQESVNKQKYTYCSANIVDSEGISNYAAIIVRNDNPNLEAIKREFRDTVSFLGNK